MAAIDDGNEQSFVGQARDQTLDVRGQRSVRRGKHGNGARELSVLDCLLMGCSRSWELVGQALPLAGMARPAFQTHSPMPYKDLPPHYAAPI